MIMQLHDYALFYYFVFLHFSANLIGLNAFIVFFINSSGRVWLSAEEANVRTIAGVKKKYTFVNTRCKDNMADIIRVCWGFCECLTPYL